MFRFKNYELSRQVFSSNYIYDSHSHFNYEMNYICSGRCMMSVQEQNITLRQGECLLLSPGSVHNFIVDGRQPCQIMQFIFQIEEEEIQKNMPPLLRCKNHCFKISNCIDIFEEMQHLLIYKENKDSPSYEKMLLELGIQRLIILLSIHIDKAANMQKEYETSVLNPVIEYMESHFEQTINMELLAKNHKVSSRYLRRIFREQVGFCACDYITMLRIEKAKDLLKNSRKSISEIALDVGYNSFQYFSMKFKKKLGMSPKDFRNQYQK